MLYDTPIMAGVAPFSGDKVIRELLSASSELYDLAATGGLLNWDQEVYMPPKGAETRSFQQATVAGIYHEKLTGRKVGELIKKAKNKVKAERGRLNIYDKALVREIAREYKKAVKLPGELVKAISQQQSRSIESWRKAKEKSDFSLYEKDLARMLALQVKAAQLLREKKQSLYDVMLDNHAPGLTESSVEAVFRPLQPRLTELGKRIGTVTGGGDRPVLGKKFEFAKLKGFAQDVSREMGFDYAAGRLDTSPHPFTTDFGINDVRITTYYIESDVRPVIFGTIHETGHALYQQGIDPRLDRTHLAGGTGLGMHESQSRFWENIIGRSPEFWQYFYPKLKAVFPEQFKNVSREEFVKAVNVVQPSLVRVEADEVTYGLHIILRFDIERELVTGRLKVKDLPKAWNKRMKDYLGIVPPNDRLGVLQDIHWAHGSFGYFPTYLMGNLIGAQMWATMKKEVPDVQKKVAAGELGPVRNWLKEKIHKTGRLYLTEELLKKVTGEDLKPQYFLAYLEEKFKAIYR